MKHAWVALGVLGVVIAIGGSGATVESAGRPSAAQAAPSAPTYTKDIAPILFGNCVTCHREGEVAPMPLMSYDQVRPWSKAIKQKVVAREMPPWFADPAYGKFANDRSLSTKQIETIAAWVDGGAPKGDDKDMPAAPALPALGWKYGEPDLVVESPVEYQIPAEGEVEYLDFYVPVPWTGDRFAEKLQMLPGNSRVVHHETGWIDSLREDLKTVDGKLVDPEGNLVARDKVRKTGTSAFDNPGAYKLICYVPGRGFEQHFAGTAKRITGGPGQFIRFDVHYQATGVPERDRSRIGLWFSKGPVTHEVITQMIGAGEPHIVEGVHPPYVEVESNGVKRWREKVPNIPPYVDNWKIVGVTSFPETATLYGFSPHMHLRGKDTKYVLTTPDGKDEVLLNVPNYDFNWQLYYELETPKKVPAGSKITAIGHFDNSLKNKYNPGPDKEVFWSEQSWDEMYEPYIEYSIDSQDLTKVKTQQQQH